MRRVAQRAFESGDCGIACAAMLAGTSYEKAHEKALELGLRNSRGDYYSRFHQLQALLTELGVRNHKQRRSPSWSAIEAPAILKVNQAGKYWHWVVFSQYSNGKRYILDPEPGKTGHIHDFSNYVLSGNHIRIF